MGVQYRFPLPPTSQKARPMALFIMAGFGLDVGIFGDLGRSLGIGGNIAGALGDLGGLATHLGGATALGSLSLPGNALWGFVFSLRPEEVVYTHPTRASVIQTLGGAWVDDFGEGLTDITLSGTTGWHRQSGLGGEESFLLLRAGVFEAYHQLRMEAAQAGQDPDRIQLVWVDTLHLCSYIVYPVSLQTRKHKSRPLLFQYQLRLTGLERLI